MLSSLQYGALDDSTAVDSPTARAMSANDVLQLILSAIGILQLLMQLWWCLRRRIFNAGDTREIGAQTPPLHFNLDAAVLPASAETRGGAHLLFTPSAAPPTRRLMMPASTPRSRTSTATSATMQITKPRLDTSLRNRSR